MCRIIVLILVALHLSILTSGHVAQRRDTDGTKEELMNELECLLNRHRQHSQVLVQSVNLDKLELMRNKLTKLLALVEGVYDDDGSDDDDDDNIGSGQVSSGKPPLKPTSIVPTCAEKKKPSQSTAFTPTSTVEPSTHTYTNCLEALRAGVTESKVYPIQQSGQQNNVSEYYAHCDMTTDGGGWTVIQRRINGDLDFNRTWQQYRLGFGSPEGEYWLGLEHIYQLIQSQPSKQMELYIKLNEFNGGATFAKYTNFSVGDRDQEFKLYTTGYTGTVGGDGLKFSNGAGFSTYDHDVDGRSGGGISCAAERLGAWWYGNCMMSNLNGKYRVSADAPYKYGFSWYNLSNKYDYFLKGSVMMVRPKQ